jgi:DNA polymerase I-like protein with 3'-5' exonuclease and polymerase domains
MSRSASAYANEILNGDIHTTNQEAAGLPTRNDAKKFIYSFLYGAGDRKIGDDLGFSAGKAKELKQTFLQTLPALSKVIDEVHWSFHDGGTVELPDGRWVQCRTEHAALNTKLQGAGAIVSKYWMVVAARRLKEAGIRYMQMAYVHDEVQYAVHKDDAERACKIITDASLEAGDRLGIKMPIHSEADIGENWRDCH